MKPKSDRKIAVLVLSVMAAGFLLSACGPKTPEQTGQIYLYGEAHGYDIIYEKELELWSEYYHGRGLRHLFMEWPYFTAEFTNLWMRSDNDDLLFEMFEGWESRNQERELLERIKAECPETIFHGTDVGHGYDTEGARYLEYLESVGQADSAQYRLARENMEQGRQFYGADDGSYQEDWAYREDKMAENFIREMDLLGQTDIVGIYGGAHTELDAKDYMTRTVPSMAARLQERYDGKVHSEFVADLIVEGYRTDTIVMGGKEYTAQYFGKGGRAVDSSCEYMEFWRLEDAFEDAEDMRRLYSYMSYNLYPMKMEDGQVILVESTMKDGSKERWFFRANGLDMGGELVAECFDPDR